MRTVYEEQLWNARKTERRILQGDAKICSPNFGKAWKAIYLHKPAEELAAQTGCTVRTAAYQLSGEHHPSAQSILALIAACTPPWRV